MLHRYMALGTLVTTWLVAASSTSRGAAVDLPPEPPGAPQSQETPGPGVHFQREFSRVVYRQLSCYGSPQEWYSSVPNSSDGLIFVETGFRRAFFGQKYGFKMGAKTG